MINVTLHYKGQKLIFMENLVARHFNTDKHIDKLVKSKIVPLHCTLIIFILC